MPSRRVGDHFELDGFVVRRRLDQGRGFALLTWWGGFVANCETMREAEEFVRTRRPSSARSRP